MQALTRSLEHNLGVLSAQNNLGRAQGTRWRALSDLLPNLNARVSETRQQINLQAFGFGSGSGSPFGEVPPIVGPFNVFDARIFLSQTVLDFGALNDAHAEAHNVEAARHLNQGARDFVLYVTGTVYVQALAMSARADAAKAQQQTAETLYNQAVDLKRSGVIAGIDVLRSEVQLNTQTQRTTIATNEFEKAKLQLARIIGLPLGQKFNLDPNLPGLPEPDISLDEAVDPRAPDAAGLPGGARARPRGGVGAPGGDRGRAAVVARQCRLRRHRPVTQRFADDLFGQRRA